MPLSMIIFGVPPVAGHDINTGVFAKGKARGFVSFAFAENDLIAFI